MNKTDIQSGIGQMDYDVVDNGSIELPVSTPATYEFVEPASYDPDAFESALDEHDFILFTPNTKLREDGEFYYYADLMTDHYKKVQVRIWKDSACVFPKDELPDKFEFARIVQAIETAFGDLKHDPREND